MYADRNMYNAGFVCTQQTPNHNSTFFYASGIQFQKPPSQQFTSVYLFIPDL